MDRFTTIISRDEHECDPLPGKFDRWINGLKEGSIVKCNTPGCGQLWKLLTVTSNVGKNKLIWVKTIY